MKTRSLGLALMIAIVAACTSLTPSASPTAVPTPTTSQQATTPAPATASPSPSASPSIAPTASAAATPSPSTSATASAGPTTPPAGSDYEQLLAHIPPAYREDCSEVTSFDTGFIVGIQCINIASVDGYLVYYQFDSVTNMNAAYQSDVDFFGSDATGSSCRTEAAEGGYTIGGTPAGRLMCADYDTGLIAYWTHEEFAILSSMVLFEGTYPDLYAIWLIAGPDPAGVSPTASPTSPAQSVSWSTTASDHSDAVGQRFDYVCPPGGSLSGIYGTDTYTADSSVCTAAAHAGLVTSAGGGAVTIEMRPGQDSYVGSERNGVVSSSWGSWYSSFVFVAP